jgi:hypothetical protein
MDRPPVVNRHQQGQNHGVAKRSDSVKGTVLARIVGLLSGLLLGAGVLGGCAGGGTSSGTITMLPASPVIPSAVTQHLAGGLQAGGHPDPVALDDEGWRGRGNASPLPDERWFAFLTDQLLRRGIHKSVTALEKDARTWIENWNEYPNPFAWTKTAEEILNSLHKYISRTSGAGH